MDHFPNPLTFGPIPTHGRPSYQHHAGFYRSVNPSDDLTKPWEASPFSDSSLPMSPMKPIFELPKTRGRVDEPPSPTSIPSPNISIQGGKRSLWRRLLRLIFPENPESESNVELPRKPVPDVNMHVLYYPPVPANEWKQYGYWARPYINDVVAVNSPVTSEKTLTTPQLEKLVRSMRSENDPEFVVHPERWIVGAKHRALPPRPTRWTEPDPNAPLPFPWEVQLNPLLQHVLWGPSVLRWCIWDSAESNMCYGRTARVVDCPEADRAQPTTWPFLTYMHFNAVLGDDAYTFPWPFTVYNAKGIKVGDVLREVHEVFGVAVRMSEYASWPTYRQNSASATLALRQDRWRKYRAGGSQPDNFLRRWDTLGAAPYFRGIEPSPDGGGWMLVFGNY